MTMKKAKEDAVRDRRWVRRNLLTFRWYLVSSVGFEAFEGERPAHHSIRDLIPPLMVSVVDDWSDRRGWGRKKNVGLGADVL